MNYKLPVNPQKKISPLLEPYFEKVRGKVIPGAYRLHALLKNQLCAELLNIPTILVTGSNGKGTVCAFIESILRHHGFKTGLYTSPHLIHPNERIRIQGEPISDSLLEENLSEIITLAKRNLPDASAFEVLTATAFLSFSNAKIDFLVCEVGLGGLFDSTNCLSPLVSVLTSISLEHTDILGSCERQIAFDKAFIARRNRPLVYGKLSADAFSGLSEATEITGANLRSTLSQLNNINTNVLQTIKTDSLNNFHFAKMNHSNLRTALCATEAMENELNTHFKVQPFISYDNLLLGISKTEWPGRFDIRKIANRTVIFDASHNPDGFSFFLDEYKSSLFANSKCLLIFASLNDKDWKTTLKKLPEIAHTVYVTQTDSARSESSQNILDHFNSLNIFPQSEDFHIYCYHNYETALENAMNHEKNSPIVITGSIAFIGLAMERFGLSFFRGIE